MNPAQKNNRITLDRAFSMSAAELATIPPDQVKALMEDAEAMKNAAKRATDFIHTMMERRYAEKAKEKRREKDTDTGTVRLTDGDFTIITDLPKKVTWDDDGLRQVEKQLADMGEPIEDYIRIKREVPEGNYKGWPAGLQKMFAPYRTVAGGKATYKMEPRKA